MWKPPLRERIHAPQIEFNLDRIFLGPQEGAYVAEFKLNLLNKGAVWQKIYIISLQILDISEGRRFSCCIDRQEEFQFPIRFLKIDNLISPKWRYIH